MLHSICNSLMTITLIAISTITSTTAITIVVVVVVVAIVAKVVASARDSLISKKRSKIPYKIVWPLRDILTKCYQWNESKNLIKSATFENNYGMLIINIKKTLIHLAVPLDAPLYSALWLTYSCRSALL